jgi:hypothetical protein
MCRGGFCKKRVKNERHRSKRKAHVLRLWVAVIIPPFIASLRDQRTFSGNESEGDPVAACAVASTLCRNTSCCRNIWTSVLPFFAVTRVDLTIDSLQITADALLSVQRPMLVVAVISRNTFMKFARAKIIAALI